MCADKVIGLDHQLSLRLTHVFQRLHNRIPASIGSIMHWRPWMLLQKMGNPQPSQAGCLYLALMLQAQVCAKRSPPL